MVTTRSAAGISFKSQALFTTVYISRYLDLFTNFYSLYNTTMKITFIASSLYILFMMKTNLKATWDPKFDTFRVEILVGAAALLAVLFHYQVAHHSVVKEVIVV
jgi:ER lumen protein retaining receptor